ncbi:hypothetical protein QRD02_07380 [Aequorivita sp. SDUM287046]|uniref:Outer membrane lipoprotein carrier protein LolA n=1 Tax=Aequorivita aurantiaca TaxID=3053356 RepID=A0ABT8DFR6_9FLAO|nr:hypothetical protein [Aequorivita aurantiaca]MDN3724200.1 hypothetical protein [Aequorivita aurantiaca]
MNKIFSFLLFMFIWTFSYAQPYTLEELQEKFKPENYTEKVLLEFQKSIAHLEEKPDLYEYIPGEVIAWSRMDGRFLLNSMFLIKNDTLREIEALPKDNVFLAKLNSYVSEESRFIYRTELWTLPAVKEKLADGSYLIKVNVKSYNPRPYEPSPDILTYSLEYTTKDFIDFSLIRLKDVSSEEWIEVGEY